MVVEKDKTEECYRILETEANKLIESGEYDPLEVAGVMCAQAIKIYKSALAKEDYDDIMEAIFLSRDEVQEIKGPTKH
jgi:hypothetical protein|tara:strand:+ start:198 stop:431 length:234 start_codon:yes stop_codon:yes gene_type:complete